jgi:hypothetical protein
MAIRIEQKLPVKRRQEIFRALVKAQDRKVPVRQSRIDVAETYGIDSELVEEIEEEGLEKEWPPLC